MHIAYIDYRVQRYSVCTQFTQSVEYRAQRYLGKPSNRKSPEFSGIFPTLEDFP